MSNALLLSSFLAISVSSLFADVSVKDDLKNSPKEVTVATKKESPGGDIGFSYEKTPLQYILSGFSGNAYYSKAVWKSGETLASVNLGGSLAMVEADVQDFEDMAGNTLGAQLGLIFKNIEDKELATSWGVDLFQSVYDSKSRPSAGVKMHYGIKF